MCEPYESIIVFANPLSIIHQQVRQLSFPNRLIIDLPGKGHSETLNEVRYTENAHAHKDLVTQYETDWATRHVVVDNAGGAVSGLINVMQNKSYSPQLYQALQAELDTLKKRQEEDFDRVKGFAHKFCIGSLDALSTFLTLSMKNTSRQTIRQSTLRSKKNGLPRTLNLYEEHAVRHLALPKCRDSMRTFIENVPTWPRHLKNMRRMLCPEWADASELWTASVN